MGHHRGDVGRSVLIVDDDPAFRRLARLLLARFGLVVAGEAETVAAALAAAAALRPSAVLVEVHLPDGDGVALARELLARAWQPSVVLTSGDADVAMEHDVRCSGAAAFVPKDRLRTPRSTGCSVAPGHRQRVAAGARFAAAPRVHRRSASGRGAWRLRRTRATVIEPARGSIAPTLTIRHRAPTTDRPKETR
jgi:CheY-like chemotaxis protein